MKLQSLDKLGPVAALLAAGGCPACFPLLAIVGSTLGLGFLRPYEGIVMYIFQGLVLLSLIGNIAAYRTHRKPAPLVVGVISPVLVFYAFYVSFNQALIYVGLTGLFLAAVLNFIAKRTCRACSA